MNKKNIFRRVGTALSRFTKEKKRETLILTGMFLLLGVGGVTTAFAATKDVEVTVIGNTAQTYGQNTTVTIKAKLLDNIGDVLKEEGFTVDESTTLNVQTSKQVKDVQSVSIKENAKGSIAVDGRRIGYNSGADTIGELLEAEEIELGENDIITPELEAPLFTEVTSIKVVRVAIEEEKGEREVPFETEEKENPELAKGKTETVTEGVNGKSKYIDKVTYHDGVEVARENQVTSIVLEPVKKVVDIGTLVKSNFGNGGVAKGEAFTANCTAYTHTGNATASGVMPVAGITIAADPSVFPLGTRIYIPYFNNTFTVQDTGGAVKGNVIDIFMETESECIQFGRRNLEAYVVD